MKKRRPFNVTKLIFACGIIFFALLVNAKNAVLITEKKQKENNKQKKMNLVERRLTEILLFRVMKLLEL